MSIFNKQNKASAGSFFSFKKVGDSVEGIFVKVENREGQFGPENVVTIETNEGLVRVSTKSNGYFDNVFGRMSAGDQIGIKFEGMRKSEKKGYKDGKDIQVYHVPAEKKSVFNEDAKQTTTSKPSKSKAKAEDDNEDEEEDF